MHRRTLGGTDIELSEIALGTWGLSGACGKMHEPVVRATVEAALEAGVTTIDCAPLWGDGAIETVVGELTESARADVQLVTRAGARWQDGEVAHGFGANALRSDLTRSLDRLRTERVDVWLLHDPPEDALTAEHLKPLVEEQKKLERIGAFGVSTGSIDVARTALELGVDVLCMPYNLLCSDDVTELSDLLKEKQVGLMARSPLLHGLLSGRWTEYRQFADDDHRKARWTPRALALRVRQVNQLRYLMHDDVHSLTEAAVRFVLASPVVTSCVLGARRAIQIKGAEKLAGEVPYLPDEDLERIGQVLAATGA